METAVISYFYGIALNLMQLLMKMEEFFSGFPMAVRIHSDHVCVIACVHVTKQNTVCDRLQYRQESLLHDGY